MNTTLSIETQLLDGEILAVILGGSLDGTTTEQFNEAIKDHLGNGRTKIIIDCRNVQSISSFGIASLVSLQARLRRSGGEVKLAALFGVAAEAIRIVGLDRLLNIYPDLEFARQSFHEPPPRPEQSIMMLP
jgi:anti-anti-sigma factor